MLAGVACRLSGQTLQFTVLNRSRSKGMYSISASAPVDDEAHSPLLGTRQTASVQRWCCA